MLFTGAWGMKRLHGLEDIYDIEVVMRSPGNSEAPLALMTCFPTLDALGALSNTRTLVNRINSALLRFQLLQVVGQEVNKNQW